jgi:very-short-patch-repair endonuclease
VITRIQLLALGFTHSAIRHRVARGRLRQIHRGVYAVGQLPLTQEGDWMAAVLACGDTAALSHDSAAALYRLAKATEPIHVSVVGESRSRKGIVVHRRRELHTTIRAGIRITTPAQTLIDVAPDWDRSRLEQAIGDADLRRLVTLEALRTAATKAGNPGAALRAVIDRVTFRVTQSELEREFLRLVGRAGLPLPETQQRFGKTRVDFYWPELQLVVETDGGQFHASAIQQLADRRRDQQHIRAGRTPLRITHWQVFKDPGETTALLVDVFTACQCRHGSESSMRAA